MPHFPKPFFKKNCQLWYVEIDRRQHNLGPYKDEAFHQYHQLMARPQRREEHNHERPHTRTCQRPSPVTQPVLS